MENNKKAVIYCRVSTKEQVDEGGSLATQEKLCKEYALKNGYEIAYIFIEQGESAKNANRTELRRLIEYCTDKKNGISAVIAYKIDRIARNIDDYRYIRVLLKRYKVEIKSTSEYFEDTPAGRFMENIIANVAQFDNDVRTERSIGGMRDAMREGRYVWVASLGYTNMKVAGKSNIQPNDKAPVVVKFFVEVAKNKDSVDAIRRNLWKEGLATTNGKILPRSHCYKILNNELYAGWIIKFGERHRGTYEPLISDELFEQVQRVLKRRSHRGFTYLKENPDFPLRRFVFHPSGKKATGAWAKGRHKKYPYYRFIGICKGHIQKDVLETAYQKFINKYSISLEHSDSIRQALKVALDQSNDTDFIEGRKLRSYINDLTEKQTALIDKNSKGIISDAILKRQLDQIEEKLIESHANLLSLPDKKVSIEELWDFVLGYLTDPGKIWAESSFKQKVRLQWFEFPKGITLENGELRTAEVACIFKLKSMFAPTLSSRVHFRGQHNEQTTTNNTPIIPLEIGQTLAKELSTLADILKGIPP